MAGAPTSSGYRSFWSGVGRSFPDLWGAASTTLYRDNEIWLLGSHLGRMDGLILLKTDLWDEAKNTRILQWARDRGADVVGIDISEPTTRQARRAFGEVPPLGALVADVREIPLRDGACDAVYSMGTIEHFARPDVALGEMYRVLKPGGVAIVGVPNRFDPFLRPLLVWALRMMGLYAYGYERSFSRRRFRRMLEEAGFHVTVETGILFLPGWLRMLDLACHVWRPSLSWVTRPAVRAFAGLDRRAPSLRRHGYLLATVAVRPPVDHRASAGGRQPRPKNRRSSVASG